MNSFYKKNNITAFDNKNVIYLAFIGRYNNKNVYKYGKSVSVYEREFIKHRKYFDKFEMRYIKITDNKDIIESLFAKELKIRNLHTSITIKNKKQTELFYITKTYSFPYIIQLLNKLIIDNPSYQVQILQEKLKQAKYDLRILKSRL
jgi:hypothetical protein